MAATTTGTGTASQPVEAYVCVVCVGQLGMFLSVLVCGYGGYGVCNSGSG